MLTYSECDDKPTNRSIYSDHAKNTNYDTIGEYYDRMTINHVSMMKTYLKLFTDNFDVYKPIIRCNTQNLKQMMNFPHSVEH